MPIETITRQGKKFAVLPMPQFKKLVADAEMLADIQAFDEMKARIESGEEELIPLSMITRRLDGESTVKIWRQHRKLTQEKLAKKSGVSRPMIAAIESGHKTGGIGTLKKLAKALSCDLDDLA